MAEPLLGGKAHHEEQGKLPHPPERTPLELLDARRRLPARLLALFRRFRKGGIKDRFR